MGIIFKTEYKDVKLCRFVRNILNFNYRRIILILGNKQVKNTLIATGCTLVFLSLLDEAYMI